MAKTQKYEMLSDKEGGTLEITEIDYSSTWKSKSKPRIAQYWTVGALLTSIALFIATLVLLIRLGHHEDFHFHSYYESEGKWQSCGKTPAEARRRGCEFDLANFSWQFEPCFDRELSEEFVTSHDWKFYNDRNATQSVPLEVVQRGEHDMWVSWELHITHCLYSWRQMHRAFDRHRRLNEDILAWGHTLHCESRFLNRTVEMSDINIMVEVNYPACKLYPGEHGYDF